MRRFDSYSSALDVLGRAYGQDLENEFVQSRIVDKFSLQFELGWKLLKGLLRYEGEASSAAGSPREILKASNACFDFIDEDAWLSMLRDRDNIMHVYDASEMQRFLSRILERYIPVFMALRESVTARYGDELAQIP